MSERSGSNLLEVPGGSLGHQLRSGLLKFEPYLLSLPILVFLAIFYVSPLLRAFLLSLNDLPAGAAQEFSWSELSIANYTSLFGDAYDRAIVYRTLRVGIGTTVLSLLLAFPLALWIRQVKPLWRTIIILIAISPLLTSGVVRTLGWVLLLHPSGLVNDAFEWLGLPTVSLLYTDTAIIVGSVHVFYGFMLLALMSGMTRIKESEIQAAIGLGASRWRTIREIVLPLMMPGIVAGCIIVFALSSSAYVVPALLGGVARPVLATSIYRQALQYLQWDNAGALATLLFVLIGAVIYGFLRPLRKKFSRTLE